MKKTFIKALGSVAVLGSLLLTACSGGNPAKNNDTFKIGISGPLTGGAAVYGLGVKNGASLAVKEINANGGLGGKLFEVNVMDDVLDAKKAAINYQSLYEGGMQVSLGAVTSGACLEYVKNAAEDNVFCLCPSATNDDVVKTNGVYQMCFSDSGQGIAAAKYIKQEYADRKVGVLYDSSDDYSNGLFNNFKAEYEKDNSNALVVTSFTSDAKTSFTAQISSMKDSGVNFVFLPIYYTEAALFIEQAAQANAFNNNTVYYGCDGLDGIETVENFDPYDYQQEISYLSHFNAASTDEKTAAFVQKYTAEYGKDNLNQFGASAYDCVYAIYQAMKEYVDAGNELDTSVSAADLGVVLNTKFKDSNFKFNGVTGSNISWNADRTVNKVPTKYIVNAPRA